MNPAKEIPTGTFEAHKNTEAPKMGAGKFKIKLSINGIEFGWMGRNNDGWCVLTNESPLVLEYYPYGGKMYYKVSEEDKYLSVSNSAYVGCYGWWGATTFRKEGKYLISDYNNQYLSLYSVDNKYLYAWDAYTKLEVEFVNV